MKKMLMTATVPSMIGQFNMGNIDILLKMGYEVHVACNFRDYSCWPKERIAEFVKELKKLKVKYHHIEYSRSPKSIGKMIKSFRQLDRLIKTENFTFVHCHTPIAGVLARICCHRNGIKAIYTTHGFHFYNGAPVQNWLLYYPIEKMLSRWTDVLITINREDYKRAKKNFCAKRTVYVPGVGINIEKFTNGIACALEKRKELGIDSESSILLSVGELNKNKNHKVVIEALGKLRRSDEKCAERLHYFIAGQGNLRNELMELADKLGVHLHLLGFRNDVPELLAAADIFILPSIREGLNVSLMEAMASRKPVVCSKIRGNTDLIDEGKGGYLFHPESVGEIREAVKKVMGMSREMRSDMGQHNLQKMRKFDIQTVENIVSDIYRGV